MAEKAYHRTRFRFDPRRAAVWKPVCEYLQRFVQADLPLLELGAGYGDFVRFIRASEKRAVEVNPDLAAFWPPEVVALIQKLPSRIPLENASCGTVVASNLFEHFAINDCQAILGEARRLLRTGGRLLIIQPNFRLEPRHYYDDYTHITPFSDVGFVDFLRANGWRVLHCEPRFLPFSMNSRLPKWSWLVRLYLLLPYRPHAGQFLVIAEAEKDTV